MQYGKHMFKTLYDMVMATKCEYKSYNYALPHCKCVLHCCAQCPWIYLSSPE